MLRSVALATAVVFAASACATMPAARAGHALRAMTYNIQYGHEGLDSVADVIRAEKPDIVGLQEVDVHWNERSNFVDQAELLAKATRMNYRFARIYQLPGSDPSKPPREFGHRKPMEPAATSVIQSRAAPPIERRRRVRREMPWTGSWRSERRACGVRAWGLSAGARW